MTMNPLISIIVIGRNEGERLVRCLQSIHGINTTGFRAELIYVDSASTDNSVIQARQLGAEVIEVKPERPCAAIGRNAGLAKAHGEYVLFLDGDTLLHPEFLQHALVSMQQPQVAVVWGHRRELYPDQSVYVRVMDLDWIYPPGESEFCGGDALFNTAVLRAVGGFNESLIAGEEPELCRRLRQRGFIIQHIDVPMTKHDLAIRKLSAYWKRAFRAGHAYAEISNRFTGTPDPLWQADARKNMIRGSFFILGLLLLGFAWQIPILPLIFILVFGLSICRTYLKSRWKSDNKRTLFLYAIHSQLQHLPIFFGQLAYYWHRHRGEKQQLVDYK